MSVTPQNHRPSMIEPLENRTLLSAGISKGGTLWIEGTAGDDKIIFSRDSQDASKYSVNVNGTVQLYSIGGVRRIAVFALAGNDSVIFDETYRQTTVYKEIYGDIGNDHLTGGLLGDYIDAGDGNDTVSGRAGDDTIIGGNGDDLVSCGAGNDSATGDANNDWLEGDDGNDTLHAGLGEDYAAGLAGNDEVHGDAGNDSVAGCTGDDYVYGEDGNDVVDGGLGGNDTIFGGAGEDIMSGNLGAPSQGQAGDNDVVTGGDGNDDFDPWDTVSEIQDRVGGDNGRNANVPTFPRVRDILNGRSFT